ncbi:MAG: carbohydrate kinase family protein [Ruminococcaceae bacterium]|nr:carbohydrate kinase family protein [Oscillospiraceae bacterium]
MEKYLCCGNIMSDSVIKNNIASPLSMGGPGFFALTGVRIFEKSCTLVTRTGANYIDDYGKWLDRHSISHRGVDVNSEKVTYGHLVFIDKNNYTADYPMGTELVGYQMTHPEDIEKHTDENTKGIYLFHYPDITVWKLTGAVARKKQFKIMWEIMPFLTADDLPKVQICCKNVDMFSINSKEASILYSISEDREEHIINELMKLPVEMTLYRVGNRGAYVIAKDEVVYCKKINPKRAVDPTGCGNTSTGAAMWAHTEGYEPAMVLAMANVAAGYNAAQYGAIPEITDDLMKKAYALAEKHCKRIKRRGRYTFK